MGADLAADGGALLVQQAVQLLEVVEFVHAVRWRQVLANPR